MRDVSRMTVQLVPAILCSKCHYNATDYRARVNILRLEDDMEPGKGSSSNRIKKGKDSENVVRLTS